MNTHCVGYTNANQLSRSCVLYDCTVQHYVFTALYSIPYLVFDAES